ncbi:MAG TPA: hypothetical protein ENN69_00500 [Spirochaetia bacterium]|nr:hypothetical protein [Spirochaetia bacterium]
MKESSLFRYAVVGLLFTMLAFSCDSEGVINPTPTPTPTPANERFLVVGDSGTILVSDDSGATFQAVTSGTTATLRGAAADADGHCVAVGAGGTVLYSADSGDTWHAGSCATTNTIDRVICYGSGKFVAVGEATGPDPYGIFRSTDGGQNWDRYAVTVTLRGIGARSDSQFVAVGNVSSLNDSALYLTYTTGASWTLYSAPSANFPAGAGWLYDAVGTSGGYFVAVGSDGSLYSADGGTWSAGGAVIGKLTAASWCASSSRLVAVGYGSGGGVSKGRIYYASSLGTTWTEVNPGTIKFLFDVADDGNGGLVAVGAAGEVLYSPPPADVHDAGSLWYDGVSGVANELYGVCHVP